MNAHNFAVGAPLNRPQTQQPLTLDALRNYAPAAFAPAPHESRSSRYVYIPTVEIIKGMEQEGFLPFKATQSIARSDERAPFTKHMIRFRRAGDTVSNVGDVVPEIVMVNSHDGSSVYELIAGLYRLACSNGLMVSESELAAIKVRHTGDVVREVVAGSFKLAEHTGEIIEHVNAWRELQLTDGEQHAFADAARTVRFADSEGLVHTPITADQLLRPRRSDDVGNDLWHTFNRVQENVIKGGQVGYVHRRKSTTRAINGIDQDVKLNRALWTLAERMAELKAA